MHKRIHAPISAFSKTQLPPELWRVLPCELPAVFLHTLLEEKGPLSPFYQLQPVLAKGRHLLQILTESTAQCSIDINVIGVIKSLVLTSPSVVKLGHLKENKAIKT